MWYLGVAIVRAFVTSVDFNVPSGKYEVFKYAYVSTKHVCVFVCGVCVSMSKDFVYQAENMHLLSNAHKHSHLLRM